MFMTHGISEQDWEAYLEQKLTAEEHDRVEAHLLGCLACWEHYEELKQTTERLHAAGAEARGSLTLSDAQLHVGLRGVFARLRAEKKPDSAIRSPLQARLDHLESVMAVMCGAHTAVNALRAAARISPATSLEQITAENWGPFLDRLTSIATVMCGETGAHLVRQSGKF